MGIKKSELPENIEGVAELLGVSAVEVDKAKRHLKFVQSVSDQIKTVRISRKITQRQLAEMLGVSVGRISQMESGDIRHSPNLKTIVEIAHHLEVEPESFFNQSNQDRIRRKRQKQSVLLMPTIESLENG